MIGWGPHRSWCTACAAGFSLWQPGELVLEAPPEIPQASGRNFAQMFMVLPMAGRVGGIGGTEQPFPVVLWRCRRYLRDSIPDKPHTVSDSLCRGRARLLTTTPRSDRTFPNLWRSLAVDNTTTDAPRVLVVATVL